MSLLQALILGIVQGLTEFLPISSSAHLVLIPSIAGWKIPEEQVFLFGVLVQMGTLIAVIIYFWQDLIRIFRKWVAGLFSKKPFEDSDAIMGWLLIIATIPAGIAGLFLEGLVAETFNNPNATAGFLLITATLLFIAEFFGKRVREISNITWKDALFIGLFQVLSLFPGISRSGSTMAGGLLRDYNRRDAGRFSFLMSVPVMGAAGLLSLFDLMKMSNLSTFLPILIVGFFTAMIVGFLSIHWLLTFISRRSFIPFAIYCIAFALIFLVFNNVVQ